MDIAPRFIIQKTSHWVVNQRNHSAGPSYLMLNAKQMTYSGQTLYFENVDHLLASLCAPPGFQAPD